MSERLTNSSLTRRPPWLVLTCMQFYFPRIFRTAFFASFSSVFARLSPLSFFFRPCPSMPFTFNLPSVSSKEVGEFGGDVMVVLAALTPPVSLLIPSILSFCHGTLIDLALLYITVLVMYG